MENVIMKTLFSILITVFCASPAFATTYYVASSGGDDSNSCTAAQSVNSAKATINGAIPCMNGGDTLYIRSGNYNEPIYVGTDPYPPPQNPQAIPNGPAADIPTTISGYPGDARPVLNYVGGGPGDNVVLFFGASNIVWNGIDINGTNLVPDTTFTAGFNGVQNVIFQNSDIYNCPANCAALEDAQGPIASFYVLNHKCHDVGMNWTPAYPGPHCWYAGADQFVSSDVVFDGMEVYNDIAWPNAFAMQIYVSGGSNNNLQDFTVRNSSFHDNICSMVAGSGTNIKIYNNTFFNNGYQVSTGGGGTGCGDIAPGVDVGFNASDNVQVYNNTFYNNYLPDGTGYALGNGGFGVVTNAKVANNILFNNGSNDAIGSLLTDTTGYSGQANLCGTFSNGCALSGDPLFVDAGNNDFHLTASSLARNAGINLSSLFTTDKDGNARPAGPYDLGSYQFVGTTTQPPTIRR
jgi:hypothetical protein